ncbi:hypothetical protein CRUP_038365, partial [Coryphaenoides rupestris]
SCPGHRRAVLRLLQRASALSRRAATSLQCRPFQIARGDSDSGAREQHLHSELRPLQIHFHPPGET